MLAFWHGFLQDLTINVLTGWLGFWQLQKFLDRQWLTGSLYHTRCLVVPLQYPLTGQVSIAFIVTIAPSILDRPPMKPHKIKDANKKRDR